MTVNLTRQVPTKLKSVDPKKGVAEMNEISILVEFMRSGKRSEILLSKYIHLQQNKGNWNKHRTMMLINQVQKSKIIQVSYTTEIGNSDMLLRLK